MSDQNPKRDKEIKGAPRIGKISELKEADDRSGKPVSRRDLLKAAAALGLGLGMGSPAEVASKEPALLLDRRASISYVLCNRALNGVVTKVEFSPGHSHLAGLSANGRLRLWDMQDLARPTGFRAGTTVRSFKWGKHERLLVQTRHGRLRAFDVPANKRLFNLSSQGLRASAFTPDGSLVIKLDSKWRLQLIDCTTGKRKKEIKLAGEIRKLPKEKRLRTREVRYLGMTHESPGRIFVASRKTILLVELESRQIEVFSHPVEAFEEFILSQNGEKIVYLQTGSTNGESTSNDEKRFGVFTFPACHEWLRGIVLDRFSKKHAFSPTLETYLGVASKMIRAQEINGSSSNGEATLETEPDLTSVNCLACAWERGVYAWGGRDGRIIVGKEREDTDYYGPLKKIDKTVVIDASVNRIKEYKPKKAWLPFDDCTCTCNSVKVTDSHNERISQEWDAEHQKWVTNTLPCGSPIPAGSVCVCNCVSAPSSPLWRTICTCDTVCTCNPQGGYRTLTYWY